jgi:hypothetical protein
MSIYHYRCWRIVNGKREDGIEEEFLAKDEKWAIRKAWARGAKMLADGGVGAIDMEYVRLGRIV